MGEKITVAGDNLTVDLLLDRRFGTAGRQRVIETMRLNPHLSGLGMILPPGTVVEIPDAPASAAPKKLLSLFG